MWHMLFVWNLGIHHLVHRNLSQLYPVHIFIPCLSNLILTFHLVIDLPSNFFPSGFTTKTVYAFLIFSHACYMFCCTLLDLITLIIM